MMTGRKSPSRSIAGQPSDGFRSFGMERTNEPALRAPDWEYWKLIPVAPLWEAVALSLGVDPSQMLEQEVGWTIQGKRSDLAHAFEKRLTLAVRNSEPETVAPFSVVPCFYPAYRKVALGEFAGWLKEVIPGGLPYEFHCLNVARNIGLLDAVSGGKLPTKKRGNGLDFRSDDSPLLDEMRRMIALGEASGPTDAARAVAQRAKGAGQESSKVTRLAQGYKKRFGDDPQS